MTGAVLDVREGRSTVYFGNEEARARRYAQRAEAAAGGIDDAIPGITAAKNAALADVGQAGADAQTAIAADKAAAQTAKAGAETAAGLALSAPIDAEKRGKVVLDNIFDPSRAIVGSGIRVSDGAVVSGLGSYAASDFMRVDPGGTISTLNALNGSSATYGVHFFTAAQATISGVASIAAGASQAVPATAYFARVTVPLSLLYQTHIVRGATAPTVFRGFEGVTPFTHRALFLARLKEMFGSTLNLLLASGITDGAYINSGGSYQVATGFFRSGVIPVTPGASYVSNKTNASGTYNRWVDGGGNTVGSAFQLTARVAVVAPAAAAGVELSGSLVANDPLAGASTATKLTMVFVEGTALPAGYTAAGAADVATAEAYGRRAVRKARQPKTDLHSPKGITTGKLLASTGVLSDSASYLTVDQMELTPDKGICANCDFVPGNAGYGWNWYNYDGIRTGAAVAAGVVADVTAGAFTLNVTSVGTTGPLLIGLPITATGVPARSYISGVPATGAGTVGVYTFANDTNTPATATTPGATLSGGGYLANVLIMPPASAARGAVSAPIGAQHKLAFCDEVIGGKLVQSTTIYSAPGLIGLRDEARDRRWSGQDFGGTGDSKTVDASGNNGFWSTLESWTRANGMLWAGGSGRKMYQALDGGGGGAYGRGSTTTLTAADLATMAMFLFSMGTNDFGLRNTAAGTTGDPTLVWPTKDSTVLGALGDSWTPTTFNGTLTTGQTTLTGITVARGALQAGLPLRGTGIAPTCNLVDLGGGSWGLSAAATFTGGVTIQGGTFFADTQWALGQVLPWMNLSTATIKAVPIVGPDQRFDDYLYHGSWTGTPGNPVNGRGLKLTDYVDALATIAAAYGLPFFDSHRRLGINRYNFATYFSDGLHDLLLCYEMLKGPRLGMWLNSL